MLRRILLTLLAAAQALLVAAAAQAAIWPEQLADLHRVSVEPWRPSEDLPLWQEYGLEAAERAVYDSPRGKLTATAWRLKDPTSALAVYQWKQPADATSPSPLEKVAVQNPKRLFAILGNYVLDYDGLVPTQEQVHLMYVVLPHLDQASLPVLTGFLPKQDQIPGSLRFAIGPASLDRFESRIPASTAAFHLSAEAQLARYRSPDGEIALAVFSYPTQHIARERVLEFQKLPGAVVKRSGPLVAVILKPPTPDAAERLLARVNYQATIAWTQKPPAPEVGVADFLITAFTFIGLLLGFMILAGFGYAGIRILSRRWTGAADDDPMVTLHLSDRQ